MQDVDRSYLSQPEVVRASRKWTCIRLATYENAEEARYLEGIYVGSSGQLENTVFAFMNPAATKHLVPPGRGPRQMFGGPRDMADEMNRLAEGYKPTGQRAARELPKVESMRLALNIAACEGVPVIVVSTKDAERRLAYAAWRPENLGKAVYVRAPLEGNAEANLLQPDKFGLEVLTKQSLDPDIDPASLNRLLSPLQSARKDHEQHLREGLEKGIRWETQVPVTDPQAKY